MLDCDYPAITATPLVSIALGDRVLAGPAIITLDNDTFRFMLLSPAGTEIFSVEGTGKNTRIHAPEAWKKYLKRLPIERDLRLFFASEPCKTARGRITEQESSLVYRGCYGPADVFKDANSWILTDPRRDYTLTMVGAVYAP
jgi:hypothetical protein